MLEVPVSNELGTLYVVATPIGNLEDISYRAVTILKAVDLIAAEDTRHSAKLLNHYTIGTPKLSLHEYNEIERTEQLIARLQAGQSIALISDAGTPLISDPGYRLVSATHAAGIRVAPIPGACAATAALSVAGLPTDRFSFEGFLPPKSAARKHRLETLVQEPRTLVFYESAHRIISSLSDMRDYFGGSRRGAIARELTKVFETIRIDNLGALFDWTVTNKNSRRGEFVVLVEGASCANERGGERDIKNVLSTLLTELPLKTSISLAAAITHQPKNRLYDLALTLKKS
jgi:16S rRNA (cytidine1402-2'-O)-methyltransferase